MQDPDWFALQNKVVTPETEELAKQLLKEVHRRILIVLETFMDISKENREIIALWIIGTYFHKEFASFPRLYINAMKGSGKSRLLQILEALCWNGSLQTNLTEAVLFRTAEKNTLLFDESESLSSKEKGTLRELLNAGYKSGTKVKRMKKSYSKEGEQQVIESFNLYSPVALANISGIEDVLGDRCISIVLEKSNDPKKVNLIPDFEENQIIKDLKFALSLFSVYKCSLVYVKGSGSRYNVFILTTLTTLITQTTLTTQTTPNHSLKTNF